MDNISPSIQEAYKQLVEIWRSLTSESKKLHLSDSFPVTFSYNSGKIENDQITLHDTQEVFGKGRVVSFTGDVRTLFEITNLKNSWAQAFELADAHSPVDEETLLSLHHTLTSGTYNEKRWNSGERPGSFKIGDYVVGDNIGYSANDVPEAIIELLREVSEWMSSYPQPSAEQAITLASYAHAKLVDIHPFADGNGRTARLITNILLLQCDCPPTCVNEEDRMAYYGALDAFHAEGNLDALKDFLKVESIKTWSALLETPSRS